MKTTTTTTALAALALVAAGLTGCSAPAPGATAPPTATGSPTVAAPPAPVDVSAELAALEDEFAATVGVSVVDTGTGASVAYRADERFAYASTLKAFAAAEFLHDVPAGERDEVVTWTAADVEASGYSPVTSAAVDTGLPLSELAEAAVRQSDNTAMNLVLDRVGGPAGLDAGLAELGDTTTEVVDREPELNTVAPGSTANTTTPAAFTADLAALLDGDRLDDADLATLLDWMSGNATGDALIRAGAPDGWTVADKSGGAGGVRNDVAVVTRPDGDPLVVTVLTVADDPAAGYDDALVARTAAVALGALG